MSIFTITLEDNDEGVLVKAHVTHTPEQMLSGNTRTAATRIGTELISMVDQLETAMSQLPAPAPKPLRH